jgi:hypothetical protein
MPRLFGQVASQHANPSFALRRLLSLGASSIASCRGCCGVAERAMSGAREVQELLDKLRTVADTIESYRATLAMLEHEQLRLRTALAATGYRPAADPTQ